MAMRSWLFVPGDSERKLAKAAQSGADVVIIDLEDAVRENAKPQARAMARSWLIANREQIVEASGQAHWVRINALDTPHWREDLTAVMEGKPAGIMLPKASGPEQVQQLSAELHELEQQEGIPANTTLILPLVSETPAAALTIAAYAAASLPRLAGLTWGAEDLSVAIGATRKKTEAGEWADAFRMVRAQVLLTAHAAGVMAVDTLQAEFRDLERLKEAATASYADGFHGMLAIHPDQVPVINAAFTPSEEELERARAIMNAFAADPATGALQVDGRMVDRPHLEQARRLLAQSR